jgi:hypothetical protein
LTLRSWSNMRHDNAELDKRMGCTGADYGETFWWRLNHWFTYYWWPTKRWVPKLSLWWHYNVSRYPKPPPLELDPVAMALGLVPDPHDGSPASVRAAELRQRQNAEGGDGATSD